MSTDWLDVHEVAPKLRIKPATVARWAAAGKICGHKVGHRWLFEPEAVEECFQAQVHQPTPAEESEPEPARRRRKRAA